MSSKEFAIAVVTRLNDAGHQALWAGGCVRDQLLGHQPKDYDVATSATPEQVRRVFGKQRTLAIGASFGVITILGPKNISPIEVATFRRDGGYSDGRRPDSVEFTDAREDALRRDFTINGMFFDPLSNQVIDFVGGEEDLNAQLVRAIRDPHERIREDKLRMLRGVRFAATFGFELEARTLAAIQSHAPEIDVVSGERIGAEMRRMLAGPRRAVAVQLLRQTGLLSEIVPGGDRLESEPTWSELIRCLEKLNGDFESAAAILMEPVIADGVVDQWSSRWKLSNQEQKSIVWILKHWQTLDRADQLPWSQVQPLLLHGRDTERAMAIANCRADRPSSGVAFCQERLAWPPEQLDPPALLDGSDLIRLGFSPGPKFSRILADVRASQLDGTLVSGEQAEAWVRSLDR